ncbi:unnamed protein product, partial [Didymodactylos carnosus]
ACKSCEKPFCSLCIQLWLNAKSNNSCPFGCPKFQQRKCPPSIAVILSKLTVDCYYKQNGCSAVIPYDTLGKHEEQCEYEQQQCSGCKEKIVKKNFDQHLEECEKLELECEQCSVQYKRQEFQEHTDVECLRNEFNRKIE